ncbi:DNA-binding protein [Clostridium tyrobutyricum]|uniref:DNA-binding protein n=1 Tax=Clostridium tyrobutyricum TaxID=1519 RepID=UPI001C381DF7|nr:DNA-binding protein [Clostridium tyrobutyricum]MBV4422955.1 DNA-binding protein [Clostridium tyrobutyricum]
MLSPQQFSKKTGLSYRQVLIMCKDNKINAIRTNKGHYKILDKEIDKFTRNGNYVSREKYEQIVRENERLKVIIAQFKKYAVNIEI